MRVIKPGTKKTWSIEHQCTGVGHDMWGCGAILEVEASDLTINIETFDSDDDEDTIMHITFKCPECGRLTDVDWKLVPTGIRNIVRSRTEAGHLYAPGTK